MEGPDIGHVVYFIVAGPFVKVGYSNNVWARVRELQTGNPYELMLAHTIGYPTRKEAMKAERLWRARLSRCGKEAAGEWVELEVDVIGPYARRLGENKKSWTQVFMEREISYCALEQSLYGYGLRARIEMEA